MESPDSWTDIEHTISRVLGDIAREQALPPTQRRIGLSPPMMIANALRDAGLFGTPLKGSLAETENVWLLGHINRAELRSRVTEWLQKQGEEV